MERVASSGVRAMRSPFAPRALLKRLSNLSLLAILLLIWQYASTSILSESTRVLLPPPSTVFKAAWELIVSGELPRHLRDSLRREFVAFLYASSAIPLGMCMGWWRSVNDQADPVIEILRPIP